MWIKPTPTTSPTRRVSLTSIAALMVVAVLAACSPAAPPTASAPTPPATEVVSVPQDIALHASVFFLGRNDSNGDGQVSLTDEVALYGNPRTDDSGAASEVSRRLSAQGISVLQFAASPDGQSAAYIAQAAAGPTPGSDAGLVLEIVQVDDSTAAPTRIALTDLTAATAQYFEDAVWVSGYNIDGLPLLRGLNPANGEVIGEHVFEPASAQVTLDPSGRWALNYAADTGMVEIYSLPAFEPVALELPAGMIVDTPQWSPSPDGARFVMSFAAADDPANFGLWIVDAQTGSVQAIDLPDNDGVNRVSAAWSDHGQYIISTARQAAAEPGSPVPPVTIVDVSADADAPSPVSLQEAGFRLSVFGWSAGDESALVLKQPVTTGNREPSNPVFPEFMLYNSASQQLTPLESMAQVEPQTVKWSPTQTTLGIVGQSLMDGQYGVYALSAVNDTLATLFSSFDTSLLQGNIFWTDDGAQVILLAPSTDSTQGFITTPLGTPFALYVFDVASGAVMRLSPEGIAVDLYNVNVQ